MRHQRILASVVWLIVAVLAVRPVTIGVRAMSRTKLTPATFVPVTPVPYTLMLEERFDSKTGREIPPVGRIVAVRSDGSEMLRAEQISENHAEVKRRIDFASGRLVLTDELRELVLERSSDEDVIFRARRDPKSSCLHTADRRFTDPHDKIEGEERILGHQTIKVRSRGATWWFAPKLGCAVFRRVRSFPEGTNRVEAKGIWLGEPRAVLFEVPARFRSLSDAQFYDRVAIIPQPDKTSASR